MKIYVLKAIFFRKINRLQNFTYHMIRQEQFLHEQIGAGRDQNEYRCVQKACRNKLISSLSNYIDSFHATLLKLFSKFCQFVPEYNNFYRNLTLTNLEIFSCRKSAVLANDRKYRLNIENLLSSTSRIRPDIKISYPANAPIPTQNVT